MVSLRCPLITLNYTQYDLCYLCSAYSNQRRVSFEISTYRSYLFELDYSSSAIYSGAHYNYSQTILNSRIKKNNNNKIAHLLKPRPSSSITSRSTPITSILLNSEQAIAHVKLKVDNPSWARQNLIREYYFYPYIFIIRFIEYIGFIRPLLSFWNAYERPMCHSLVGAHMLNILPTLFNRIIIS